MQIRAVINRIRKKPILKADRPEKHERPGWVYIMFDGEIYKIGLSQNPKIRKWYLERDYGQLKIIAVALVLNMRRLEKTMHDRYQNVRIYRNHGSGRTEWFRFDRSQLADAINNLHWSALQINFSIVMGCLGKIAIFVAISWLCYALLF